ncbi:putative codeinone reductase (NADPH) [Helianthus anomalus]
MTKKKLYNSPQDHIRSKTSIKVPKQNTKKMVTIPETMISSSEGARPCPVIAMGTSSESGIAGKEAVSPSTLVEAIKMGYRHFDTAALYRSEKPVGDAIAEALSLGLIKSRSEIFVTTKLWCNSADRHLVLPAIKQSLK